MKCWSILLFLAGLFGVSLTAETILELPFRMAEEIKAWRGAGNAEFVRDGNDTVLHIRHDGRTRNSFGISRTIDPERIAGRRITCSAEVKRDLAVHRKWQGAKLIITVRRKNGDQGYYGVYMEPGKFDWTKVGRTFDIPQDITSATLFIGIQSGTGEVFYKNLKITADDLMLDLAPFANMGYADEKSGDGKGGNFNADDYFDRLRKAGFLPRNNRSNDAKGIYETSTGEILMETKRCYMQVDTPRLQGICAEAGTKARLTDFEIRGMSVRGNIAVVSLNRTPLKDSERMVLVIATNALNDGIIFEDKEMRFLKNIGNKAAVIQTGKFTVALGNKNASDLKAYALSMSGERIAQIPVSVENGKAVIPIDTAKTPTVFFELATK